jgi:hypothetical protein
MGFAHIYCKDPARHAFAGEQRFPVRANGATIDEGRVRQVGPKSNGAVLRHSPDNISLSLIRVRLWTQNRASWPRNPGGAGHSTETWEFDALGLSQPRLPRVHRHPSDEWSVTLSILKSLFEMGERISFLRNLSFS